MPPIELLVAVSGGAVLPYVASAAWDWFEARREHRKGA